MIIMYDENGKFYLDAKDKAILQKCVYENPYIPFNPFPKQAEMILATEKEVLIGGAAGGSLEEVNQQVYSCERYFMLKMTSMNTML